MEDTKKKIPKKFSSYHPIIPKNYTPAWKQDMQNRSLIIENATYANLSYNGTDTSLYLEKRERLSSPPSETREEIMKGTNDVSRDRKLRPWFHSPLSKYQSTLMARK